MPSRCCLARLNNGDFATTQRLLSAISSVNTLADFVVRSFPLPFADLSRPFHCPPTLVATSRHSAVLRSSGPATQGAARRGQRHLLRSYRDVITCAAVSQSRHGALPAQSLHSHPSSARGMEAAVRSRGAAVSQWAGSGGGQPHSAPNAAHQEGGDTGDFARDC